MREFSGLVREIGPWSALLMDSAYITFQSGYVLLVSSWVNFPSGDIAALLGRTYLSSSPFVEFAVGAAILAALIGVNMASLKAGEYLSSALSISAMTSYLIVVAVLALGGPRPPRGRWIAIIPAYTRRPPPSAHRWEARGSTPSRCCPTWRISSPTSIS